MSKTIKNSKPGKDAAEILSSRLEALRLGSLQYNTLAKVAAKAGFGEGSVRNLEDPVTAARASLDNIAKAASVFGLEPWEMLHPDMPAYTVSKDDYELLQSLKARYDRPKK